MRSPAEYRKTIVATVGAVIAVLTAVLGDSLVPSSVVPVVTVVLVVLNAIGVYYTKNADPAPPVE